MRHLIIRNVPASLGDLKPAQIFHRRTGTRDRGVDGILDRNRRGAGQFNKFVNVIACGGLLDPASRFPAQRSLRKI